MRLPLLCITIFMTMASHTSAFVQSTQHCRHEPLYATLSTSSSSSSLSTSSSDDSFDYASVEFPPPLSPVDRLQRAATFWSTAVPIVASYYGIIGRTKLQELLGQKMTDEEMERLWIIQHETGAQKLADTVAQLKGFYVKTAQIISARQDLFPKQYTDALSMFTDNVDPMPTAMARAVVTKELLMPGEKFEDVFSEFDEAPLGAAYVRSSARLVVSPRYSSPHKNIIHVVLLHRCIGPY